MKKRKIFKTLAVFGACMCAPFVLAGCTKDAESKVDFRVQDGYIQVTEDGTNWKNLVDIDDLKGDAGQQGVAGKQVEFQKTSTHIQWRYIGDVNWKDLITLEELKGDDLSFNTYNITYDYGLLKDYFNNGINNQTIKSTEWITSLPEIKTDYKNFFSGWFIQGTDKKIEKYDYIGGNIVLEARFDISKEVPAGLYHNGKYIKEWSEIITENAQVFSTEGVIADIESLSEWHNLEGELVIDDSITTIKSNAFTNCEFSAISIPSSTITIEDNAFWGTLKLARIYVDETNPIYESRDNGSMLIHTQNKQLLKAFNSTIIPNDIEIIGNGAFHNTLIKQITISNSVIRIDACAFQGCKMLEKVVISESVKEIDNCAFNGCTQLEVFILNTKSNHKWQVYINVENEMTWVDVVKYENGELINYITNYSDNCLLKQSEI